jgi:integrase
VVDPDAGEEPAPKRGRQPRGEGSISKVQRRFNGKSVTRYRLRLRDPLQPNVPVVDRTYRSRPEALQARRTALARLNQGEPVLNPNQRVGPLLEKHLATKKGVLRHRSYLNLERHFRIWTIPYFAPMTLARMNTLDELNAYVTHLLTTDSATTHRKLGIEYVLVLFQEVKTFLETCVAAGYIGRSLAATKDVALPELPKARINLPMEFRYWTLEEALRYQEVALRTPRGIPFLLQLHWGLRSGETRGVLEHHLHLDGPSPFLLVLTQVTEREKSDEEDGPIGTRPVSGGRHRGEGLEVKEDLKTPAAYRIIPLSPTWVALLRQALAWRDAQRAKAGARWDTRYALVFTTRTGAPFASTSFRTIHYTICDQAGVRRITNHGLRHMATSLLLAAGVPRDEVIRILGHRSTRELEGHQSGGYTDALREWAPRTAGVMERLLPLPGTDLQAAATPVDWVATAGASRMVLPPPPDDPPDGSDDPA